MAMIPCWDKIKGTSFEKDFSVDEKLPEAEQYAAMRAKARERLGKLHDRVETVKEKNHAVINPKAKEKYIKTKYENTLSEEKAAEIEAKKSEYQAKVDEVKGKSEKPLTGEQVQEPSAALIDVESTAKALEEINYDESKIPFSLDYLPSDKKAIAEAYHADKAAGKETGLTKAVESLLSNQKSETTSALASVVDAVNIELKDNKIKGRILSDKQSQELQKEIENNYIPDNEPPRLVANNKDIRTNVFNYDNPIAEKTVNGVELRIAEGLTRNKEKTYLLYADGKIVGEFYSVNDAKNVVKYIESNLIKPKSILSKEQHLLH
jgi:hypothetical protein